MAKRLKDAEFSTADVQVLGPDPRKGNLAAWLRGTGARKPILLLQRASRQSRFTTLNCAPPALPPASTEGMQITPCRRLLGQWSNCRMIPAIRLKRLEKVSSGWSSTTGSLSPRLTATRSARRHRLSADQADATAMIDGGTWSASGKLLGR